MISPEALRRYPYFAEVSESSLKAVAMLSEPSSFREGERLFEESGEFKGAVRLFERAAPATHLMILTQGQVDVVMRLANGEETIVGSLVPGDVMADSALIEPYRLRASGVAKTDGNLIQIEASGLRRLCEEDCALGYRLMKQVAAALSDRLEQTRVLLAGAA
ncbi:MAG TPA: cyclic nucleotide-binding domain-containing protein [Anaerolineales bacterium]|nr:cyclic nucleotide-binding domain-containing protein [Anaerolineales bacterium]